MENRRALVFLMLFCAAALPLAGCSDGKGSRERMRDASAPTSPADAGDAPLNAGRDAGRDAGPSMDDAAMEPPASSLPLPLEPVTSLDVEIRYECDLDSILPYTAVASWTPYQRDACLYGVDGQQALCPLRPDGSFGDDTLNCIGARCEGSDAMLACIATSSDVCLARTGCAQEAFDVDCCERAVCGELTPASLVCQRAAYGTGVMPGPCVAPTERRADCASKTGCSQLVLKICEFVELMNYRF